MGEIEGEKTEGCLVDKADFSTSSRLVGTSLEMTISGLRWIRQTHHRSGWDDKGGVKNRGCVEYQGLCADGCGTADGVAGAGVPEAALRIQLSTNSSGAGTIRYSRCG